MNKHIVVFGSIRSGTQWLAKMFGAFTDNGEEITNVRHEGFKKMPIARMLYHWKQPGIHINVGDDAVMIDLLCKNFPDLQIAVVVRDPLDQLLSIFSCDGFRPRSNLMSDTGSFLTGMWNWGNIDQVLARAKALGIEAKTWHMDYYTTAEGFKELATSLGLKLRDNFEALPPINSGRKLSRPSRDEWNEGIPEALQQMHRCMPQLGPAYIEAKQYAEKKLAGG